MALPANPNHNDIAFIGDSVYQYDSNLNRWSLYRSARETRIEDKFDSELTNFKINSLADVNISYTPEDGTVVAWDSDQGKWSSKQFTLDPLGAIELHIKSYTITSGNLNIRLEYFPIGSVLVTRNGIGLTPDDYSVSGKDLTLNVGENGDSIHVAYNRGTSIALTADLNDMSDVSILNTPKEGDVLKWDSDNQYFKPFSLTNETTTLQENIDQVAADRIFTDNVLSSRIDDLDSDNAAQTGNFYVQPTAPAGAPHSGWVNTTNMKLYVWDVTSDTWIQCAIT